jgi:hypothetical protein
MNNQSVAGTSYPGPGNAALETQNESSLLERLKKTWSVLGEALSNTRSIGYKLFTPEPCSVDGNQIEKANTENIEDLICLIESVAAKLDNETRKIGSRI